MAVNVRIENVQLEAHKHINIALRNIYGIGKTTANKICDSLDLAYHTKVKDLTDEMVAALQKAINPLQTEGDLRRYIAMRIKRKRDIRCYVGIRHSRGLPVRGQRTRTNARTRKGKKKVVSK